MLAEAVMEAEVAEQAGAAYGERSPERITRRNGYRPRRWDTRAGERGGEQQARVVHETVVIEGDVYRVGGCSLLASNGCSLLLVRDSYKTIVPATAEHPTSAPHALFFGGSRIRMQRRLRTMTTSTHSRRQANREHLEGHGFEQEQAMALADVLDGLTADIGAKLEKTTEEIKGIVDSSRREQAKKMGGLGGASTVTKWIVGVYTGFAVAAAVTMVVLVFLLFTQG